MKVRKRPLKLATRLANGSQDDAPKMASVFMKMPKRKIFIVFFLWRGGGVLAKGNSGFDLELLLKNESIQPKDNFFLI